MKHFRGKDIQPRKRRADALPEPTIAAIRAKRAEGVLIREIAKEFGVTKCTVLKYTRGIVQPAGKSWYSFSSCGGQPVKPSAIVEQGDGTAHVLLNHGFVAVIDADDRGKVEAHRWFVRRVKTTDGEITYARAQNQTVGAVFMHNLILPTEPGYLPDHKNRNGLDNRKQNLRAASRSGNAANRTPIKTRSGFIGVTFYKPTGRWNAHVGWNYKHYSAGYFADPEDAARARDDLARRLQGDFAVLNFPEVGK